MHRLFWKIFLSFWGALILFTTIVVLAASGFVERMRAEEGAGGPRARAARYAHEARAVAGAGGIEGLRAWLAALDRRDPVPFYALDDEARDLLGRDVPDAIAARASRHRARGGHRSSRRWRFEIQLSDGARYALVPDFQGVTLGRVLRRPRVIATPLLAAALIAGLVGFFLARYVTAPLGRLRHATERVAAGELDHRVTPSLGARRDEVAELARSFDDMAARVGALIGTQRQLVRDISHELRSPLARLQAALDLARQRTGDAAKGELDRIELETRRLDELIGQLLSLARLESGNEPLSIEPVSVDGLLDAVVADAAYEARASGRDVRVARTVPVTVEGDPRLLRQAFENVVRNAVRYTAEGSAVEVALDRDAGGAVLASVRDCGPGVPEEMLARLFEPFVRVGEARDRASGGYGLGLAIAERSVRALGGRMVATNEPGGGLRVAIHLPG